MGYADATSGDECVIAPAWDGLLRCLPLKRASEQVDNSNFSSSTCTGDSVALFDPTIGQPTMVHARSNTDTCGNFKVEIRSVGAIAPKAFHADGAGKCSELTDGYSAITLGAPIAPSTFPEAKESAPWGTGRIKSLYYAVGQEPVSLRAQFDTTRNEACVFSKAHDGETRCMPHALRVNSGYFVDASCTTEAIPDFDSCGADPKYYVAAVGPNEGHFYNLSKVGAPTTLYGKDSNGKCGARGFPTATYYAVGAEVPIGSFEKVTVRDR